MWTAALPLRISAKPIMADERLSTSDGRRSIPQRPLAGNSTGPVSAASAVANAIVLTKPCLQRNGDISDHTKIIQNPAGKEDVMKGINGFGHAALKVKDLDASLAFYAGKLGFPEMLRLHKDDGSVWLVYLRITDEVYLEIFPGADSDRAPGWNANGVNHLCLMIDDLDDFCPADRSQGRQADRGDKARRRRQPPGLDRGSRRQSHRTDGDASGLPAVSRVEAPARGGAGAGLETANRPGEPALAKVPSPPEGYRRRHRLFGQHRIAGVARQSAHSRGDARSHPVGGAQPQLSAQHHRASAGQPRNQDDRAGVDRHHEPDADPGLAVSGAGVRATWLFADAGCQRP